MPHTGTRRPYGTFERRMSKHLMSRKVRKLFSEISRDISAVESRMFRQRGAHA